MISQVVVAYAHFIMFAVLVTCLIVESVLLCPVMPVSNAKLIKKFDMLYGISAVVMIVSGIGRVFLEKGKEYYFDNLFFWIKMVLFLAIGILSVFPTVSFLKWQLNTGTAEFGITIEKANSIRRYIYIQLFLLPFIPLCAVLMEKGYGIW